MRKFHVSWDFLMGFIRKAWDMRFSCETGDFLVGRGPYEKISCLLSHEIISYLMRFSHGIYREGMRHEIFSWDRRFSCGEVPPKRNLLSPVSWENLTSHKIFSWDLLRKHETLYFSWDRRFSHETGDRRFSRWGGAKTDKTWDFLLRYEIFSWDRRQEIFSLGVGPKLIRH